MTWPPRARWARSPAAASTTTAELRVHRVPFSTNVERVSIAAAHKGVAIAWVDHDPADRSAIRALSGQDLVPVLETPSGEVVTDSPAVLRWLEAAYPDPPLWPADPAHRARVDVLVEWFNGVWKGPPNALAADPGGPEAARHAVQLRTWTARFDALLADGPYLVGDALTVADVVAYPFLRYGVAAEDPADADPFHAVLREHCAPGPGHARLRAWLGRMGALPGTF